MRHAQANKLADAMTRADSLAPTLPTQEELDESQTNSKTRELVVLKMWLRPAFKLVATHSFIAFLCAVNETKPAVPELENSTK